MKTGLRMRLLALLLVAGLAAHGAAAQQLYNARGEPIAPAPPREVPPPPPPEPQPSPPPPPPVEAQLPGLPAAEPQQTEPRLLASPAASGQPAPVRRPTAVVAYTTKFSVQPSTEWNPGHQRIKSYPSSLARDMRRLTAAKALTLTAVNASAAEAAAPLASVPQSFLGLSIDLNDIEGVAHPDFIGLVQQLTSHSTGPMIFRMGANSADRLVGPWPAAAYKALSELHAATGAKFIMGVNQHAEDPSVTKQQVEEAVRKLPAGSIVGFAPGNEPDMYTLGPKNGKAGSLMPKQDGWLGTSWIPTSQKVYTAAASAAPRSDMLAGPDWSHVAIEPAKLEWWLRSVKATLGLVSVHHYGGDVFEDDSIADLVSEARMTSKLSNLPNIVRTARNYGLPVRITEAATLSYGGVQGISDTAGAAIWALDAALEAAAAGAEGMHFHQVLARGSNANYNAIDYDAAQGRVRAKLPIWGLVMFQQAVEGGADILGKAISGECKVWLLRGRSRGDLRAVIINKAPDGRECAADLRMSPAQLAKYGPRADAQYLYATAGLPDRWRIYYSGAFYDSWGSYKPVAERAVPMTRYETTAPGGRVVSGGWAMRLTNGTLAALVTIPRAAGAA
ncbi:hypothetical protein Rsub_06030 [Raphidocelis subcapitata]|uniref:Uncharacterized protein n=1 Tax=Raphidocelis subcapitata TaxID=307507 RepID=A0A2V0P0A3_9CHLO|nr:hypothetical protein Rsub_06030 [Raphidocelis subcapitata]|eukprot:GBF93298.1 hypothetical protein Rsub_06030 [Raphidocelis subcapitata]